VAAVESLRKDEYGRYEAITAGLSELYPEYRESLVQLAQEEPAAALAALQKLAASEDVFLAADASYYLARAHALSDRFDESLPLLEQLTAKLANKTVLLGEAVYLRGVCESRLLQREQAVASFERFLKDFPTAPERMKIGAIRQLEQLKQFKPETITDVFERMDFARRRLAREQTGESTQEQQNKVVDILAKLIKEAEERECNCQGGGQGEGQSESQGQNGGGEGEGQGGDGSGSNDKSLGPVVKKIYRGPQSPWSQLRDKERDPAYSAIKEKFPARYEKLIEQYYRSFDEE
jgi:tetratricopeptide (TPR) repeat protein